MTSRSRYSRMPTSLRSSLLLLIPLLASASTTVCPGGLRCHHGGECATGDKDYSDEDNFVISSDIPWFEQLNINGEHCTNCDEGWGGLDCKRKYQECNAEDPDAPTCFHGAECYKKGINVETGKYDYICDCTTAYDGGLRFAGEFCQHLEEKTCDGEMFCTNGGKCEVDLVSGLDFFVCKCPSGRTGTHCEFTQDHHFEDCTLDCARGKCAKGFKSYDNLIGTGPFPASLAIDLISPSGEHCVCPPGWTGLKCDIEVKRCGAKKYCYNGSSCIYDGQGVGYCDCNTAHTDDKSYAGLSCEHEGTSYCEPGLDQDQKDAFCANGGVCVGDPLRKHEGCECPEGWTGDLCDIKADDEDHEEQDCDLDCNGGSCRFGVKGYKDLYDELDLAVYEKTHMNGMYCSCPAGFTGLQCEAEVNHCHVNEGTSQDHFCLNGTPCSTENNELDGATKKFQCDCDKEEDEITQMLAGRFCEYAVTEFCSKEKKRHNHSFCTNGGKCKSMNDHDDSNHHGCCCPDGYEGEYCQLPKGSVKEGTAVTWSPLEECEKKSQPQHLFVYAEEETQSRPADLAKSNGTSDVSVVGKDSAVEDESLTEPRPSKMQGTPEDSSENKKSSVAAISSCMLAIVLIGGLVTYRTMTKPQIEEPHQFDGDAVWPPPSDSHTTPNFARTWHYPTGHSMSNENSNASKTWEYSDDHGDLHNVVI